MADNTVLNTGTGGDTIATDDIAGIKHQLVKVEYGAADSATQVSTTNPLPVDQTNTSVADGGTLPAKGVQVGGTDGTVFQVMSTDNAGRPNVNVNGTVPVSGPLTDAQLRATAVPVSGTVTASGPLTDAQLRATAVPVSGTVTANGAVTNAGTFAVQDSQKVADNAAFTDGTTPVQPVGYVFDEVAGTALTENDAAAARIDSKRAQVGVIEDATTRGQRAAVSAGGALKVDNSAVTQPVSAASLPLPAGASTAAKQPALGTAGAASADVLSVQGVASMTALKVDGSAVTQPVSLAGTQSVNQAQVAGTTTDTNSGVKSAGTQRVVLATDQPQLTNALKVDGSAVTQPVSGTVTANIAAAAGATGLSKFHLVSAATANATNVKASAGKLHGWYIYNSNAAARKVAFHNTAGSPAAGTGVTDSIVIPPTSAANAFSEIGIAFSTGIAITTVTDLTDAGATAVGLNDLVINLYYV